MVALDAILTIVVPSCHFNHITLMMWAMASWLASWLQVCEKVMMTTLMITCKFSYLFLFTLLVCTCLD